MRKMLIGLFAFACVYGKAQKATEPVIMVVGDKQVSLAEFEYIAHKNNEVNFSDAKSLTNYVELFKSFKLKVLEAESLGFDKSESFEKEWSEYKNQLISGYLSDRKGEEDYARSVYARANEYLVLKQILVPFQARQYVSKDTLAPYKEVMEIYDSIVKGLDFDSAGVRLSSQTAKFENIPYFLPMQKTKAFEDVAYSTSVGTISKPFRSAEGYHIIKVESKRPYFGGIHAEYINIPYELDSVKRSKDEITKIVNDVYAKAIAGENFTDLVYKYSVDTLDGGVLAWFGPAEMLKEVEVATYSLAKPGDISKPVVTDNGAYIFRLIEKRETTPFEEVSDKMIGEMKRKDRERNFELFKSYDDYLKKEYKFALVAKAYAELEALADEFFPTSEGFMSKVAGMNKPLFSLNGKNFSQKDFGDFVKASPLSSKTYSKDFLKEEFELFVRETAMDFEKQNIEVKHPEIALLLQEYRDGILLFDISNDKIWNKPVEEQESLEAAWLKELNGKYSVKINSDVLNALSKGKK